ncbi:CcgAII protein [Dickeya dadantii]|uniref:CcgAII protein n=1 Tax=Dickeya dadantii TaxID=204038 RepID=UPI0020A62F02|nr:CcgAII protein [Dickeya dadantii]
MFDVKEFLDDIEASSKIVNRNCGLSYELFQRRLSAEIDNKIQKLPTEYQDQAIELAREHFDYISKDEIEEEIRNDMENGICCHGIDKNCCPSGCGEYDDDEIYHDYYFDDPDSLE